VPLLRGGGRVIGGRGRAQLVEKQAEVVVPAAVAQLDGVVAEHGLHRIGHVLGPGEAGTVDQDGNDRPPPLDGGGDLEADVVLGIVDPPAPRRGLRGQPPSADHGQQHVGVVHRGRDGAHEVGAGSDAVDVEEDDVVAERVAEVVSQTPREPGGVVPPVAQKDATHQVPRST